MRYSDSAYISTISSEMALTKSQLQEALDAGGISYPPTATVTQLRVLYDQLGASGKVLTAAASSAVGSNTLLVNPNVPVEPIVAAPTSASEQITEVRPSTSATSVSTVPSTGSSDILIEDISEGEPDREEEVRPPPVDNTVAILERLQREKQILELQQAINLLRRDVADQPRARQSRIEFKDVENSVPEFTGDDTYGIRKWILDFEEVVDAYNVDAQFRYMCARRLLKGTAKISSVRRPSVIGHNCEPH